MIKSILVPTDSVSIVGDVVMSKFGDIHILTKNDSRQYVKTTTKHDIVIVDTEAKIVEGDKYLYKETFLDGTIKTQEQFDNANWSIDVCRKGDIPYIERARNGRNAQTGLLAVFKIIPHKTVIKLNQQGEVDITIPETKESWNREEVKELVRKFRTDVLPFGQVNDHDLYHWLNKNL